MAIDSMTLIRVALIPLSILTFSLIMASLCGNTWLYNYTETTRFVDTETRIGLWFVCATLYDYGIPTTTCIASDTDVKDFFQATRAFLIMATMPALIAIILCVVVNCSQKYRAFIVSIPFGLTALFLLIGLSSFTGRVNANDDSDFDYSKYSYGWSHNIGWLAFPLTIGCAVLSIVCGISRMTGMTGMTGMSSMDHQS
ncbi:uncharacterized protein LOC130636650 [Hydractinia symbiolongicarpus]|uniref:uncharacterized protein LOC130636650 n=1 Tax=Hydractinia symbiolongicarpus TaxID=13093 RepID=UPI002550D772|nr:uncharacterized protein LOC130636650 [Hydractinia symbiolongicarpus]